MLTRSAVRATSRAALEAGILEPIRTRVEEVEDGGIRFAVRQAEALRRKPASPPERGSPFLDPEPELLVADLSTTHRAVLNRFPVIEDHLLVVTRGFVDQATWLDEDDFGAWWSVLLALGGLGFYNAGEVAGASQAHKHLQVVPLPLGPSEPIPVEARIRAALERGDRRADLPFPHALAPVAEVGVGEHVPDRGAPLVAARDVQVLYRDLLGALGIDEPVGYNLLVTPWWMLAVPRTRECIAGISVNALGFAGSLLAKDEAQLQAICSTGPMTMLRQAAT